MSLVGGKMTQRNTKNFRAANVESSIRQAPIAHWRSSDNQEQPLEAHLDGVSRLSRIFAAKIGLQDAGELIGALHDLGKYSKEFQDYLRSAVGLLDVDADDDVDAKGLKGKVDHSTAGAQYIWKSLARKSPQERIAAQVLALCVASHHSGLIDCIGGGASNFGQAIFPRRMSKAQDKTHLDEVQPRIAALQRARPEQGARRAAVARAGPQFEADDGFELRIRSLRR